MGIPASLAIIILAALIHASFQLSVSVLTLLSAHTLGTKKSHRKLVHLTTSFVLGAGVMTILLLSFISLLFTNIFGGNTPQTIWAVVCGLLISAALLVWMFYYRRGKGTALWIPRSFAKYLTSRTEATKLGAEAFGLGISSVIGEIFFIIAPLTVSALVLVQLPAFWQLIGLLIYTVISLLSLLIVWTAVGKKHSISKIQKWRENNKYFLQFIAGIGLVALSFFVYVNEIVVYSMGAF